MHWVLFKYNQTILGNGFIIFFREIDYILSGILSGKSAFPIVLWILGILLIVVATILIICMSVTNDQLFIKMASILNIGGAILFLISVIIQYGIFFHGPEGIAIPFGIPVILGVAYWQYRISLEPARQESGNDPVKKN